MNQESSKIKSFTDLKAWQESHGLVLDIYRLTKDFPKDEVFGLTNQIRRASVSISSNIAEGFSRYSFKEKSQFYSMALGSCTEVQNQLLVAKDIGYISVRVFESVAARTVVVNKIVNGLIMSSRTLIRDS